VNLSFLIIYKEGLSSFKDLKKEGEEDGTAGMKDCEFKASHDCQLKNHANLHRLYTSGDKASADIEAVKVFP
jgi:hypothetical protein